MKESTWVYTELPCFNSVAIVIAAIYGMKTLRYNNIAIAMVASYL